MAPINQSSLSAPRSHKVSLHGMKRWEMWPKIWLLMCCNFETKQRIYYLNFYTHIGSKNRLVLLHPKFYMSLRSTMRIRGYKIAPKTGPRKCVYPQLQKYRPIRGRVLRWLYLKSYISRTPTPIFGVHWCMKKV